MSGKKKSTRRPSIKMAPHEKRMLQELYLRWRVPRDQFKKRPETLASFVLEWNKMSGRVDVPDEIIRYIMNRQKNHDWVTFDGNHLTAPKDEEFTIEERDDLVQVYSERVLLSGRGSDALASDQELRDSVSNDFASRTGRIVPGITLAAILESMRKRGYLPLLGEMDEQRQKPTEDQDAFDDIDEAGPGHAAVG